MAAKQTVEIRKPFTHLQIGIDCSEHVEPSRTKQNFKEECDINNIMAKYQKTGIIEHAKRNAPQYGDFPPADYHTAMNIMTGAQQMFESLPSSLRNRFGNSPLAYLEFVSDPANQAEMKKLGLLPPEVPTPEQEAAAKPGEGKKPKETPEKTQSDVEKKE